MEEEQGSLGRATQVVCNALSLQLKCAQDFALRSLLKFPVAILV